MRNILAQVCKSLHVGPADPEDHVPDWIAWTLAGVAVLVVIALAAVALIARLRRVDAEARRALASFDRELERRTGFLDELCREVRRVADHERAILAEAAEVRALVPHVLRTGSISDRATALARLESVTADLTAIVDAYPDLSGSPEHDAVRTELLAAERDAAASAAAYDREAARYNALLGPLRVTGVGRRQLLTHPTPVVE